MVCNIKNVNVNNILFYFLLILIILATGIIFKKYTNIYEGFDQDEADKINNKIKRSNEFFDIANKNLEDEMEMLDKDSYDKMLEALKKNYDLKLKSAIWRQSTLTAIEKAYKEKELIDKISGGGSTVSSMSNSVSKTGGFF